MPVLLNISINDLEETTEHMLAKSVYDTKLEGAADMLEGRTASSVSAKKTASSKRTDFPLRLLGGFQD